MMKRIIQMIGIVFGGVLGAKMHGWMNAGSLWTNNTYGTMQSGGYYLNVGIGALCGLVAATVIATPLIRLMRQGADRAAAMPTGELLSGAGGTIVGLMLSALIYPAVAGLTGAGILVPAGLTLFFGYAGMQVGLSKREEIAAGLSSD